MLSTTWQRKNFIQEVNSFILPTKLRDKFNKFFIDSSFSGSDGLITFRVNPAMEQLNATYIAQTLGGEELRSNLRTINNLQIVRAGVGRYSMGETTENGLPQLQFQQTAVVQSESAAAAEAEIAKKYDVVDPTFAFIVTDPA